MVDLASYLFRAMYLLGLAIAPRLLSPDPYPPRSAPLTLLLSLAVLGALLWGARELKRRFDSLEARIAAGLVWVAVAASLAASIYWAGPRAPLAQGAAPLAAVVWPALAAVAAAVAGRYLGSNWKHKRSGATAAVLAAGIFIHADAAKNMGDVPHMWSVALTHDPANETAFERVTSALLSQGKLDEVSKRAAACLRESPGSCKCLVTRVQVAQKKRDPLKAVEAGATAAEMCPTLTAARAANAEALAMAGRMEDALKEADEAIVLDDEARGRGAKASILMAMGRTKEAEEEAAKAGSAPGGSREAGLLVVSLAINNGDLDAAEKTLKELQAKNPQDTDVLYNLALVADKRGKYNEARNGYLAALRIDPRYKAARYNLAVLTYRRGVVDEARNHARKYAEIDPGDPSAAALLKMVNADQPRQAP